MKIIVDVPEEDYKYLKDNNNDGIYNVILNGKIIPDDCKRLCDIDKLKNEIEYCMWACDESFDADNILCMLDDENENFVVLLE